MLRRRSWRTRNRRGRHVVGSNIFNLLAVLGFSGLLAPADVPVSTALLNVDLPVMLAAAVACLSTFASGATIARWEGAAPSSCR